jgi:hypothetical protein
MQQSIAISNAGGAGVRWGAGAFEALRQQLTMDVELLVYVRCVTVLGEEIARVLYGGRIGEGGLAGMCNVEAEALVEAVTRRLEGLAAEKGLLLEPEPIVTLHVGVSDPGLKRMRELDAEYPRETVEEQLPDELRCGYCGTRLRGGDEWQRGFCCAEHERGEARA